MSDIILNSKFRKVYKEDISFGEGSATVENNSGDLVTVHDVNATDIPVVYAGLKTLGADVEEVLIALNDGNIDGKLDAVGETRDIETTGDMKAVNTDFEKVSVTTELDVNDTVIINVSDAINPTDAVNKSQLDAIEAGIVTEHNDLDGLNEGDYLHLSEAEKDALTDGNETDLHSHEVSYDDLTNKPTAGDGIDLTDDVISNTKISENSVVSKLVAYTVGSEAIDPAQGEMTMSVLSDARMKVKIYPDVNGLIYDRKRDCTIRFRNENRTNLNGIVEMYLIEDVTYENGIYTYIALNTLWNATDDMPACAGLQQTFSLVFDNAMISTGGGTGNQTALIYDKTTNLVPGDGEIWMNEAAPGIFQFSFSKVNNLGQSHQQFENLKEGAVFNVFKESENVMWSGQVDNSIIDNGTYWTIILGSGIGDYHLLSGEVVIEFVNEPGTGGTGTDDHLDLLNIGTKTHVELEAELSKVKVSDNDTTTGRLIDKISAGSNVTITTVDEGGDEKLLITSSGEVSTIVKQGVNYYNLGSDICNNVGGVGQEIVNISSVNSNGTGWLMKSANGNVLTDIPLVANITYADGLSPAIPILDNTKAIQMKLRTGNCRVFDTNRNDKTGIAYVEINVFELDSQSIISTNHSLVETIKLYDIFGTNNNGVVGSGQTSNIYVTFELTNLNGIFTLDSAKQYGFTISGTSDQNPPKSVEKIHLMDTAILTVIYEGEVL